MSERNLCSDHNLENLTNPTEINHRTCYKTNTNLILNNTETPVIPAQLALYNLKSDPDPYIGETVCSYKRKAIAKKPVTKVEFIDDMSTKKKIKVTLHKEKIYGSFL